MNNAEQQWYDVNIPKDLDRIVGIHDGKRWLLKIIPGSVSIDRNTITFTCVWDGRSKRQISMAIELVAAYQQDVD